MNPTTTATNPSMRRMRASRSGYFPFGKHLRLAPGALVLIVDMAMTALGYILFGLGCVLGLAGDLKFLVVAYRQSLFWFFGCLFLPFVSLLFLALNFRETWRPALLSTIGFIIAGVGYRACGFEFLL